MSVSEKSIARINKASVKDAKPKPKVVENTAPSKEVTTGVIDRKSVVKGKSVRPGVDLGGRRSI